MFSYMSLMTNDMWHLFLWVFAIHVSSLVNCLLISFPHFGTGLFHFLSSFDRIPLLNVICKHSTCLWFVFFFLLTASFEFWWSSILCSFVDHEKISSSHVWVYFWTLCFIDYFSVFMLIPLCLDYGNFMTNLKIRQVVLILHN